MQVHWISLIAFAGIAVTTAAVGLYATRIVRTTQDAYIASRAVGPLLNASAISGEYLSAASFLGVAGLVMAYGYDMLWYPVGFAAGYLFLLLFVAAPLRRFGAFTIPDFAEGRFGSAALRRIALAFVLAIALFYILPQMKAAGLTVQTITGLPYWLGVVVVGGVIVVNVSLSGMKGITFAQAFLFWVKAFAFVLTALVLLALFGSYSHLWSRATAAPPPPLVAAIQHGQAPGVEWGAPFGPLARGQGFPLLSTYSLIVATVFGTAGLPHILVRFYTNRDGHAARQTTLVVLVMIGLFYLCPPLFGLMGRVHAPDLYASHRTDAVLLELPGRTAYPALNDVLRAVTAAGAFAAFASTASGLLVTIAGTLAHDLYVRTLRPAAGQRARLAAFRLAALAAGAIVILLGLRVEGFAISLLVGWAFAIAASAFFPLLVLGIWWDGLTVVGAAAGTLLGGGLASASILYTIWSGTGAGTMSLFATLLAQPAIWTIPTAFAAMAVCSLLTRDQVPADIRLKMLRLHVPEALGLRLDYIDE